MTSYTQILAIRSYNYISTWRLATPAVCLIINYTQGHYFIWQLSLVTCRHSLCYKHTSINRQDSMLRTEECMIHLLVSICISCDTDATESVQITIYKYLESFRPTNFILGSKIIIRRQKLTVHKIYDRDCEGRLDFHGIYEGEIDSTIVLFRAETLFQLARYRNSESNKFSTFTHKVPLQWRKAVVWCAESTTSINGFIFFWDHILTPIYYTHSDAICALMM